MDITAPTLWGFMSALVPKASIRARKIRENARVSAGL